MLQQYIIAGTNEDFEGHLPSHTPPPPPQIVSACLGGCLASIQTHRHKVQCLVWGIRRPFPTALAIAVMAVLCVL
jgi:hypothetical protein